MLGHWHNSPRIDKSPPSDALYWFRNNQSFLYFLNVACLAEKHQISIWTHDLLLEASTLIITPPMWFIMWHLLFSPLSIELGDMVFCTSLPTNDCNPPLSIFVEKKKWIIILCYPRLTLTFIQHDNIEHKEISTWHFPYRPWYQPETPISSPTMKLEGWYGLRTDTRDDMKNLCHNLFITYFTLTFFKHLLLYCRKDVWTDKLQR